MFRKIQLRLTFFAVSIITLILLVMTLGYSYISEKNLKENRLLSYRNDMYTIVSNLEQQSVITHSWLAKLESGNLYSISLMDNDIPLLFNSLEKSEADMIDQAWSAYRSKETELEKTVLSYQSYYQMFSFHDSAHRDYWAFVIHLENRESHLEMLLLAPLSQMKNQLFHQRFIFLGIVFVALFLLCILCWFFIGRLLRPVEESRIRQNRFVASASHELRTPLAVILSCVEDMQESQTSLNFTQNLTVIHDEALRMSNLLKDMLTLSSQNEQSFMQNLSKEPVELDTLLLNACETFETLAKSKQLKMSVSLPDALLPPVNCDKARIEQLLAILLHNAISYTPNGGNINLSLLVQKSRVQLAVSDTGAGIPDSEKEKIFDSFYRREASRSNKEHFGLGLAIASGIVKAHHGTITVKDHEGGGAIFLVSLPL